MAIDDYRLNASNLYNIDASKPMFSPPTQPVGVQPIGGFQTGANALSMNTGVAPIQPVYGYSNTPSTNVPAGQASPSTTQRTPVNFGSGSFTAVGATVGSGFSPVGTAVGAGAGLAVDSLLTWYQKREQDKEAKAKLKEAQRQEAKQDKLNAIARSDALNERSYQRGEKKRQDRIDELARLKNSILERFTIQDQFRNQLAQYGRIGI